jgi:hypothetical protein
MQSGTIGLASDLAKLHTVEYSAAGRAPVTSVVGAGRRWATARGNPGASRAVWTKTFGGYAG